MREYRQSKNISRHVDAIRNAVELEGYVLMFDQPRVLEYNREYVLKEEYSRNAFADCDFSMCSLDYDNRQASTCNNTLLIRSDRHGLWLRANMGTADGLTPGTSQARVWYVMEVAGERRRVDRSRGRPVIIRTILHVRRAYLFAVGDMPKRGRRSIAEQNSRTARDMLQSCSTDNSRTVYSVR